MQKASEPRSRWRRSAVCLLIALLVAAADQLSKTWIRANLLVGESQFETEFFRITHLNNAGAAFGLFQGQSFLLTIIALAGVAIFLLYAFVIYRGFPFLDSISNRVALGLIIGGTAGNLIDRLRLGYVTDFIDFSFWPAFNIADSTVTVGVILFAYSIIFEAGTKE